MRLNNIPLYRYTTFCLSIHRHLDCFHFLAMKNNVVMKHKLLYEHIFTSIGYICKSRIGGSGDNPMSKFLRN